MRKMANKIQISTTISIEYKEWLDNKGFKMSEAMARGVRTLMDLDEGLDYRKATEELYNKIGRLQEKINTINKDRFDEEQKYLAILKQHGIEINKLKQINPLNDEKS